MNKNPGCFCKSYVLFILQQYFAYQVTRESSLQMCGFSKFELSTM